ncbi:MAG: 1-deoxy-D-xylulose-5-phosphate reductoisomerase [Candidatus Eisenbacteria bacterium]|nr:1-deoxy-D-xylulose-5-phosphate reductoisomerase [Candidatus Eisenbacteria bacterium]
MPGRRDDPRGIVILGATGQIGRLTLELISRRGGELQVRALAARRNATGLAAAAARFQPAAVALADSAAADRFRQAAEGRWRGEILVGAEGLATLAAWDDAEIVVNAMVGAAGLPPSLVALQAGHRLALANKESLVIAGALVMQAAAESTGRLLPIDSEHSALLQCLSGRSREEIARLILTASGGPLRGHSAGALARVTPAEALRHPTWEMGPRITIDAATLFNKGMELIEAHWLFDVPFERLGVWVHPQSIVHALVEFRDGALLAHLSAPDMRLPIQYALSHPVRWPAPIPPCDLTRAGPLGFEAPDATRFPCLRIAQEAGRAGGTAPAVANAADEVLVVAFLSRRVPLTAIATGLETVLGRHRRVAAPSLEQILAADAWAREEAEAYAHDLGART